MAKILEEHYENGGRGKPLIIQVPDSVEVNEKLQATRIQLPLPTTQAPMIETHILTQTQRPDKPENARKIYTSNRPFILSKHNEYGRTNEKPTLEVLQMVDPESFKRVVVEDVYVAPPPDVIDREGYIIKNTSDGKIERIFLLSKDNNYGVTESIPSNKNDQTEKSNVAELKVEVDLSDLETAPFVYSQAESDLEVPAPTNIEVRADVDLIPDPSTTPIDFMSKLGQISNMPDSDLALIQGLYIGIKAANALSNLNSKLEIPEIATDTTILDELTDTLTVAANIGEGGEILNTVNNVLNDVTDIDTNLNVNANVQTTPLLEVLDPEVEEIKDILGLPNSLPVDSTIDISAVVNLGQQKSTNLDEIKISKSVDCITQQPTEPVLTVTNILDLDDVLRTDDAVEDATKLNLGDATVDILSTSSILNPNDHHILEESTYRRIDESDLENISLLDTELVLQDIEPTININKNIGQLNIETYESEEEEEEEEALVQEVQNLYTFDRKPIYTIIHKEKPQTINPPCSSIPFQSTREYDLSTLYPSTITKDLINIKLLESLDPATTNVMQGMVPQQPMYIVEDVVKPINIDADIVASGHPNSLLEVEANLDTPIWSTIQSLTETQADADADIIASLQHNPLIKADVNLVPTTDWNNNLRPLHIRTDLDVLNSISEETLEPELLNLAANVHISPSPKSTSIVDLLDPLSVTAIAHLDTSEILNTKIPSTETTIELLNPNTDINANVIANLEPDIMLRNTINLDPSLNTAKSFAQWNHVANTVYTNNFNSDMPISHNPTLLNLEAIATPGRGLEASDDETATSSIIDLSTLGLLNTDINLNMLSSDNPTDYLLGSKLKSFNSYGASRKISHKPTFLNLESNTDLPDMILETSDVPKFTSSKFDTANVDLSALGLLNTEVNLDMLAGDNFNSLYTNSPPKHLQEKVPCTTYGSPKKITKIRTTINPTNSFRNSNPSTYSDSILNSHPSNLVPTFDSSSLLNLKLNTLDNVDVSTLNSILNGKNLVSQSAWTDLYDMTDVDLEAFQTVFEPTEVFSTILPVTQVSSTEMNPQHLRNNGDILNLNLGVNLNGLTDIGPVGQDVGSLLPEKALPKVNYLMSTIENIARNEEILTTNDFITTTLPGNTPVNEMDMDFKFGKKSSDPTKEYVDEDTLGHKQYFEANYNQRLETMLAAQMPQEKPFESTSTQKESNLNSKDYNNVVGKTIPESKSTTSSIICPIHDTIHSSDKFSTKTEQKPKSCRHIDETAVKGNLYFIGSDGMKIPLSMALNEYGNIELTLDMVNICDDKSKLKIESQNNCDLSKCTS